MDGKDVLKIIFVALFVLLIAAGIGMLPVTQFLGVFLLMLVVYWLTKWTIKSSNDGVLSALWLKITVPLVSIIGYFFSVASASRIEWDYFLADAIIPIYDPSYVAPTIVTRLQYLFDFNSNLQQPYYPESLIIVFPLMILVTLPFIFLAQKHVLNPSLHSTRRLPWKWALVATLIISVIIYILSITGAGVALLVIVPVVGLLIVMIVLTAVFSDLRSKK